MSFFSTGEHVLWCFSRYCFSGLSVVMFGGVAYSKIKRRALSELILSQNRIKPFHLTTWEMAKEQPVVAEPQECRLNDSVVNSRERRNGSRVTCPSVYNSENIRGITWGGQFNRRIMGS
ncbi:hypothetical protein pipiens_006564 [Culex pipiens pipiens]|uniref:Uncharacterized protein n=1 Tax=Culex pipiens pipiens TaxID=38569 RepID=A0ABD1DP08_CULPP